MSQTRLRSYTCCWQQTKRRFCCQSCVSELTAPTLSCLWWAFQRLFSHVTNPSTAVFSQKTKLCICSKRVIIVGCSALRARWLISILLVFLSEECFQSGSCKACKEVIQTSAYLELLFGICGLMGILSMQGIKIFHNTSIHQSHFRKGDVQQKYI